MADEQNRKQDRVRFTILVYQKPGMSRSDFSKYWREQHAGVFASIAIVKKNLLNYQQVRETCIRFPRSMALRGLMSCPLFRQAHVDEGVSTSYPDALQSIQDTSPKIRLGCRDTLVTSQQWA